MLGDARNYAPTAAALINGTLAHSLDFDDTHAEASLHSSAPIVPAALAAAELSGSSGKDLIAAVVAGYEVQIRLSLALNPSDHYDRGFHPTATCGVFGAAAAAGKLFGMDAAGIQNAFGIALSQAAGSMEFLVDGAWTKRSHVGQAAQNGLICAAIAAEGFKGTETGLRRPRRFPQRLCSQRRSGQGSRRPRPDLANDAVCGEALPLLPLFARRDRRTGGADEGARR